MTRHGLIVNGTAILVCLAFALSGCGDGGGGGGGGQTGGGGASSGQGAAESSAAQDATLLDVLHLCNSGFLTYSTNNNGNVVDFHFMCNDVTWDGTNFSVDHDGPYEPRVGVQCERHIKVNGRVSDDGKSIEQMTVDVETRGPSEGRIGTEKFTLKNIAVDSLYETPASNWRDSPYMVYKLYLQRSEVPDHVEDWSSSYQDANIEPSPVDQEGRMQLTMPAEDATMSISISFSSK